MNYILLSAAVVLNVAAYAVFRSIAHRPHDSTWLLLFTVGLALGATNLFCFTSALRQLSLAVAYPVFSGATIALMVATAALLFGERVTYTMLAGSVVIVLGVYLLTRQ
ncbi:MAG TPA: SMR family transporter [Burkholderiales bacterium]|nr:SMR family transporter [Burkholderiales bacterium]